MPIDRRMPTQSISTDALTTTTTTATTSTPIDTRAPTRSISTDDSTTTTSTASTTSTPIDTQTPTQSSNTSTEAKPAEPDPRRAAFQRRPVAKDLDPGKLAWGHGMAKALGLPIPSSQARLLNEGLATAGQIAGSNAYGQQDKQAASQHEQALRAAGNPPWGADTAMQAADAKVQLDLLSIPPNNRKLSPLGADLKGVNKTFWIENLNTGGTKDKAFLCKPASAPGGLTMPSGGQPGGEVAREALAGRAAQFLLGKGRDIGMPETHVVKLSGSLLPGNAGAGAVTCSVQQFGDSVGQIGPQSRAAKGRIDGKKVAALGVFDMMTLANDRHGGNILLGPNGELIPIDHGENFTETTDPSAAARLKTTLRGVGCFALLQGVQGVSAVELLVGRARCHAVFRVP
jgi:Phosphatidylinositol 3- and 4-kinase